jgi:hypothetical protein
LDFWASFTILGIVNNLLKVLIHVLFPFPDAFPFKIFLLLEKLIAHIVLANLQVCIYGIFHFVGMAFAEFLFSHIMTD